MAFFIFEFFKIFGHLGHFVDFKRMNDYLDIKPENTHEYFVGHPHLLLKI